MTKSNILCFGLGLAVGSIIASTISKNRVKRECDEEINAIRKYYSEKENTVSEETKANEDETEEELIKVAAQNVGYNELIHSKYASLNGETEQHDNVDPDDTVEEVTDEDMHKYDELSGPYTIEPEEFGVLGYEKESLIYYEGDNVLTDYEDNKIVDIPHYVGFDALSELSADEDNDVIYVRNDTIETDFEIQKDIRSFEDAMEQMQNTSKETED